jgi:GNAT superfamily N-acetyltransferase
LRDGRQLVLRGATRADVDGVFELCVRRLAIEHDALDELQTSVEAFARAFAAGKFHLLVAEIDGALAGAATYQYSYRTWTGESLYLQDLCVAAANRGQGVGTQLIRGLAAVAVAGGCDRMFWESQVGNARANEFYGSTVGADTVLGEHQLLTWKLVGVDRLMRCASVAV